MKATTTTSNEKDTLKSLCCNVLSSVFNNQKKEKIEKNAERS
jgi:hypothetical protein